MQFLHESLVELITQTATNLPPDVRQAMGIAIAGEIPGTQASQALGIIAANIDMAADDQGPICQDTGMPTFDVHTPVGVNQMVIKKAIRAAVAEATKRGKLRPNSVDSLTGKNSGDNLGEETPVIHCEQWEQDEIEVKLILKGGGCENKNIQYSLPTELEHLGKAGRDLTPCGRRRGRGARREQWECASGAIARTGICWRNTSCSGRWTIPIRSRS
jgi:fumarate hydratase class I